MGESGGNNDNNNKNVFEIACGKAPENVRGIYGLWRRAGREGRKIWTWCKAATVRVSGLTSFYERAFDLYSGAASLSESPDAWYNA